MLNQFTADKQLYLRLLNYMKPYSMRFWLALITSIPSSAMNGLLAWLVGPFLDSMISGQDKQFLWLIPIAVIAASLVQGIFVYMSNYYNNYLSFAISRDIRRDLYRALNKMDLNYFKIHSSGDLLTRYYTDPTTLQQAIVTNLQGFIVQFFSALFLAAVLFYRNWKLALIAIGIISLIVLPLTVISKKIRGLDHVARSISARLANIMVESIYGIKEIIANQLQAFQHKRFNTTLDDFFGTSMRITKTEIILKPIMQLIASIGIALILYLSIQQIESGNMTRGDVASFLLALILLYKPVKVIGSILGKVQRILAPAERVFEKMDLKPTLTQPKNAVKLKPVESITFENVTFSYEANTPILKNINLNINANETIALVGPSGGGKTTLIELLPRFLDPVEGRILFNGHDLKEVDLESLRSQIGLVSQDVTLFDATIEENIRMGRLDATDEEVWQAVEGASLAKWINSDPEGLQKRVGERGNMVSGGQKQRIAIARAFLKNSPILILDEATSALDSESEKAIQAALNNIMQNRTVIVIAHRLSTIKNADRILVLNHGELIESGQHEELLAKKGLYYKLHELQFNSDLSNRPNSPNLATV